MEVDNLLEIHTRKELYDWYLLNHDKEHDKEKEFWIRVNRADKLAVMPDWKPEDFVFQQWTVDALKEDPLVWNNFQSFPDAYRRIKLG